MKEKLSVALFPPTMLRNILKNVTFYFQDDYNLCVSFTKLYTLFMSLCKFRYLLILTV